MRVAAVNPSAAALLAIVPGSTVREVRRAGWKQQGKRLIFEVTADAFLYHMVRRMVFVQVSLGQGKLDVGIISRVLNAAERQPMFQGLAPSQGLRLVDVSYPSEAVRITNQD